MTILSAPKRSHLVAAVHGLIAGGWSVQRLPDGGCMVRNGQLLRLVEAAGETRYRMFVYKVTGSSRGKPEERRIEITSTYQKGLKKTAGYRDVVLGLDADSGLFVGVDPRRLEHGGATGNASSFFDAEGLASGSPGQMVIRPRTSRLLGLEFHAFFAPFKLGEYLANFHEIHRGSYAGDGAYSGNRSRKIKASDYDVTTAEGAVVVLKAPRSRIKAPRVTRKQVTKFERGDSSALKGRKLTRPELQQLLRLRDEVGFRGEQLALAHERKRLKRAGKRALANQVSWMSQSYPFIGYDIKSFETDGSERWIEVKSTTGSSLRFEMSNNEWETAESAEEKYYIYRVTRVRAKPSIRVVRNPAELAKQGKVKRSPAGWIVRLV